MLQENILCSTHILTTLSLHHPIAIMLNNHKLSFSVTKTLHSTIRKKNFLESHPPPTDSTTQYPPRTPLCPNCRINQRVTT